MSILSELLIISSVSWNFLVSLQFLVLLNTFRILLPRLPDCHIQQRNDIESNSCTFFFLFIETIRGNLDVVHFRCKNEVSCACNILRIFSVVQIWETWTIWGMEFLLEKSFSQGEPMRGHLSGNIQQTTKDVCIREIFEKKGCLCYSSFW